MNGNVWLATNESQGQDDIPKTEKSTENGAYVGEQVDDAELYEGGVALSPSDS
jgi:hypothetical protein